MSTARKIAWYLRPYWKPALIAPLFMVVEVTMDLMQPRLIQRIVDVGLANRDMPVIINTGLLMVGLALIGAIGGTGCSVFAVRASMGFGADLRSGLFRKVQSLSFSNLDEFGTGSLVTRLTNDITQVQELVLMLLRILVRAPLMLVGSVIMAVVTSPRMALLLLVLAPVLLTAVVFILRKAQPMFTDVQQRLDKLNTLMQEMLAGVRVVKAFVRGEHEIKRFGTANEALAHRTIDVGRLIATAMPIMMMAVNVGVVGVIWFGGLAVTAGTMHVGQIIAFVNYLLRSLMSLMMVSMLLMRASRAGASADRIVAVLDSEPAIQNSTKPLKTFAPRGQVTFENVTFAYDGPGSDPVLRNVNFTAEPGQTVALLGATGSGKSSLVHLIPRFYDVSEGRVTIDGVDVRDVDKEVLRRNIGIALQEPVLFSGTIRHNIRYGRPGSTDEEVVAVAKAAQAHDFITAFPDGYDTMVNQGGVNVSGGQKQRIAIARALILNPAVLVLDDSTSSVDVETEARIQEALTDLMRGRTSFVIAQRISTVLNADKILVLDDGMITAEGTHSELMTSSPVYREIYDSQLGNGVENYG